MANRSNIYIDGFNLYYGVLRNSSDKWLDLSKYFHRIRTQGNSNPDEINAIHYFTAKISGSRASNQESYLDALATTPLVKPIFGLFKQKTLECRVSSCSYTGTKSFSGVEEKGTDVNIALQMLDDAYQNVCDRMVLVSADSDLAPALRIIRHRFPKIQITLYLPYRNALIHRPNGSSFNNPRSTAKELRHQAHKHGQLPIVEIGQSQFPPTVVDISGRAINKPLGW